MAFMCTDLSGVIRIGNYTPTGSIPLGKGKEQQLRAAAIACGAGKEGGPLVVPGLNEWPHGPDGYFARKAAIATFAGRVQRHLKGLSS